jgi:Zn-dependent membrane protease YugP
MKTFKFFFEGVIFTALAFMCVVGIVLLGLFRLIQLIALPALVIVGVYYFWGTHGEL